jgi:hypothetical protein
MLPSPEIEAMTAQMKAVILRDSEGYFDGPQESKDLQITVRVACEVFAFLKQSSDLLSWLRPNTWLKQSVQDSIGFSQWLRPGLSDWLKVVRRLRREVARDFP